MKNTQGNTHTKFGSNWSSSVREVSCIIVNNEDDNDGGQVMAIDNMAFGSNWLCSVRGEEF